MLTEDDQAIQMGPSTRVWATDWNGDGWLDLLVGDSTSLSTPVGDISEAEWKKRRDADDQKISEISMKMQEFMPEYTAAFEKGESPPADIQTRMDKLNAEMQKVYQKRSEYQKSESTGHVWLIIRKPDQAAAEAEAAI